MYMLYSEWEMCFSSLFLLVAPLNGEIIHMYSMCNGQSLVDKKRCYN